MFSPEFIKACRRFMELRDVRDHTKQTAKTAEEAYREAEAEMWEQLAPPDPNDPDYKLSPTKVPLGQPWGTVTLGPRETHYARVIDADDAADHYENRGLVEEVSTMKFNMGRLNEEVRQLIESGEKMPDGIDYYTKRFVAVSRPK